MSRINSQDWRSVARVIEHTLLRPEATPQQIRQLCAEAREYGFGVAMVNACYVDLVRQCLEGSETRVGAVIGFPLGATLTNVKVLEAAETIRLGAQEVDMVINVGELKGGNGDFVLSDIDRKSTRLNSSHPSISYAVFCLKKKKYRTIIFSRR